MGNDCLPRCDLKGRGQEWSWNLEKTAVWEGSLRVTFTGCIHLSSVWVSAAHPLGFPSYLLSGRPSLSFPERLGCCVRIM